MKKRISRTLLYLFLIIYAVISLYPLIWMIFFSFKDNSEIFVTNPFGFPHVWRPENYPAALESFDAMTCFKNSLIVSAVTILIVELSALMFCYVVSRVQNRITKGLKLLIHSGMFIPVQAVMIPLIVVVRRMGFTNSLFSVIVPYSALGLPFACFLFMGFYQGLPVELEESAYLDGAGFPVVYFRIIMPQLISPIVVLIIYQFMSCWNEYNLALILLTKKALKTLPLGLVAFWSSYEASWGIIGAAMVLASIPVLLIYLFFSNKITDAMAVSGMKN